MPDPTAPTPEEFRRAMGQLPTGVTVVSAPGEAGPLGATANAVASLSLDPPLMVASLDVTSRTLQAVRSGGRFGISVLAGDQEWIARAFATKAPHFEKWADVPYTERAEVPIVDGAVLWIACEIREAYEAGDHVVLIGTALEVGTGGGDALLFHRGAYRAV